MGNDFSADIHKWSEQKCTDIGRMGWHRGAWPGWSKVLCPLDLRRQAASEDVIYAREEGYQVMVLSALLSGLVAFGLGYYCRLLVLTIPTMTNANSSILFDANGSFQMGRLALVAGLYALLGLTFLFSGVVAPRFFIRSAALIVFFILGYDQLRFTDPQRNFAAFWFPFWAFGIYVLLLLLAADLVPGLLLSKLKPLSAIIETEPWRFENRKGPFLPA
jgi:hypothetical protein